MSDDSDSDRGICILSFDSGGPGTYSQLLLIKEYMRQLAVALGADEVEIYPVDYFDLMGGVGFGGLAAFMLGRLRMTVDEAIDALLAITSAVFPSDSDVARSPETNLQNLKEALEIMLEARGIQPNTKMSDRGILSVGCKVAIYAATLTDISKPRILRTYQYRGTGLTMTIIEALCATIAIPSLFAPVKFRSSRLVEHAFIGGALGANNPTRELLKEARLAFGNERRVAQIISLGATVPGDASVESFDSTRVYSHLASTLATDCEMVASELSTRLFTVDAYVRLNVDTKMGRNEMDDWRGLATIENMTLAYMKTASFTRILSESLRYLQSRIGTATLGQINFVSNAKLAVKMAPAVSPYFVLRNHEWFTMVRHLVELPSSNQKVFVITGMGGCGKTQMVSYFLQEKSAKYTQTIFVDASSSSSLKTDLQAWAQSLGGGHEQDVWEDALRILASKLHDGQWLLVLDSADNLTLDLATFIPSCYHGTVIITSRNRGVGDLANTHHLELGEMGTDEALSTLLRSARRQMATLSFEENINALKLTNMLGRLAVALVQAGTYCHQLSTTTLHGVEQTFGFAQYISLFSSQHSELMNKAESSSLDNYQLGAYTAFNISYGAIPQPAREFLHFISSFDHSHISLAMFANAAGGGFADPDVLLPRQEGHSEIVTSLYGMLCNDAKWDEIRAHETIRLLRAFSLVSASSMAGMVFLHLHPLVHTWARSMLESNYPHCSKMAIQVLTSCSSRDKFRLHQYLLPHIHGALENNAIEKLHVNDLCAFGAILGDQGYYDKAEESFTQILDILRQAHGGDSAANLRVATLLIKTYHAHGRWKDSEALALETLEQSIKLKGEDDKATIEISGNLASTYSAQGRHEEAGTLGIQVLEQRRRVLGEDHPDAITAAANLATTHSSLGRHMEAEKLELEVLGQLRRSLGNDHPRILTATNNLAATYRSTGRYKEAEALQVEVLNQLKRILGKDHPNTLTSMINLAATYSSMGRYRDAEDLQVEALKHLRRVVGQEHPLTISVMSNLAACYYNQQEWGKAEPLLIEAVTISRSLFGDYHPKTQKLLRPLARVFTALENFEDAEEIALLLS